MTTPTYGRRRGDRTHDQLEGELAAAEARVEECGQHERIHKQAYDAAIRDDSDEGDAVAEKEYRYLITFILRGDKARREASWRRHELREREATV